MSAKLTLRVDEKLVAQAKEHARRRGKSVSQMFGEYVVSLSASERSDDLPPTTRSLLGVMKGSHVSESDYKKYVDEKYS